MTKKDKILLLVRNKSKLEFLQITSAYFFIIEKFLLFPLTLGFIFSDKFSSFIVISIFLTLILHSKSEFFKSVNILNIIITILCLVNYLLLFVPYILFNTFNYNLNQIPSWIRDLKKDPLTGLGYMFLYASFFKIFFMFAIYLNYIVFVKIDQIDTSLLFKIKKYYSEN